MIMLYALTHKNIEPYAWYMKYFCSNEAVHQRKSLLFCGSYYTAGVVKRVVNGPITKSVNGVLGLIAPVQCICCKGHKVANV